MRGLGMVGLLALVLIALSQTARVTLPKAGGARNVILFVGDGLGPTQMRL